MTVLSKKEYDQAILDNKIQDKEIFLVQYDSGEARFIASIGEHTVCSETFFYDSKEVQENERDALEFVTHALRTGWKLGDESECMYCGALAHSPRVTNVACPCRTEES